MLLSTPKVKLDWKAKSFTLPDPNNKLYSLDSLMGDNGLVIAFICNHCPYVKSIIHRFVKDANELKKYNINTVAIMSNDYNYVKEDNPSQMLKFSKLNKFTFPYLIDKNQDVAKEYDAVCTPDFFGFNSNGTLQYRGRLDDSNTKDTKNRKPELLNAMIDIASINKTKNEQHPSIGCSIKWI